jgi:hypothetical protein
MPRQMERCAICLDPLALDDVVERAPGVAVHLRCLERARKPGAKAERPAPAGLKNARTDTGDPICPVCGEPIGLGQGAAPSREYMLHVTCWDRGGRAGL